MGCRLDAVRLFGEQRQHAFAVAEMGGELFRPSPVGERHENCQPAFSHSTFPAFAQAAGRSPTTTSACCEVPPRRTMSDTVAPTLSAPSRRMTSRWLSM